MTVARTSKAMALLREIRDMALAHEADDRLPWVTWIPELLRKIDSVISCSDETNAWQPIDTAPQSGKWVLLWWPRVTDAAMIGYRVSGEWRTAPGGDAWAGFDGPTHWQPSPAGPALKANTLPPCECLLIDKEPSAYHALKCPRYVADKI